MPPIFEDDELGRRLELLEDYDILNTPPEPEFDDIVLVASEACNTPVSLVSLVEVDRQWFKARVGFEACETPIEQSVCAHSLSSPNLLIIPDLALDPRTKANTLVTRAPFIRFYAGAPLVSRDGIAIGTLCVIDTEPRPEGLNESQQKILTALARQVMALLELRRTSHRKDELFRRQKDMAANIRATASKTLAAQEAGRIGTFEVDISTNTIHVSPEFCRIFGVPLAQTYPASLFEQMVLPEDQGIQSTDETRADGSSMMTVEYRIKTANTGTRWISRHATMDRDANDRPVRMLGTVQDVTEAKRTWLRTQALVDLGDRLRDLDSIDDMSIAAADLMGKALDAARAGFGVVDPRREIVDILPEWCAEGVISVAGQYDVQSYATLLPDLRRGETVVISNVASDPRMAEHADRLLALNARAIVIVPIIDHGRFTLMAFVHHDEPFDWTSEELSFVKSFADRVQIAIARVQSQIEQDTLNHEIEHRLKNTFAMVQAIATQTLRPVTEREHVSNFEKRLFALSRAHDILLHGHGGATVRAIVESLSETLARPDGIEIAGPDVAVGSRGALSMGLLLHELATNAVKYGALSQPGGLVRVHWSIDKSGGEPVLKFLWRESGGPAPSPPEKRGFGSKLIQMGLIGTGGVTLSYQQPGFYAEMSASLQQLQQAK